MKNAQFESDLLNDKIVTMIVVMTTATLIAGISHQIDRPKYLANIQPSDLTHTSTPLTIKIHVDKPNPLNSLLSLLSQ